MTRIVSSAQLRVLEVVVDMIDRLTSNGDDNLPKFGRNIMDLILGILNVDINETVTVTDIDITDIEGDKILPINPDNSNDRIQINIPNIPSVQVFPGDISHPDPYPFPPQVWYNQEPEPYQTDKAEDVRYTTCVSCTEDKNCITTTYNTNDIQYNGDFRDVQTSFNDK